MAIVHDGLIIPDELFRGWAVRVWGSDGTSLQTFIDEVKTIITELGDDVEVEFNDGLLELSTCNPITGKRFVEKFGE